MNAEPEPHIFENTMSGWQTALGWLYLPVHCILLPILLGVYVAVSETPVSPASVSLVQYAVAWAFVLLVMMSFLREGFDVFLDDPLTGVMGICCAMVGVWFLEVGASLLLLPFAGAGENPNNAELLRMGAEEPGKVRALAVFLAPVAEEVLFRGVVFGSLRPRHKRLAYAVSALLFALNHVWAYALDAGNPWLLLHMIEYIPVSLGLAWCYDRTGSIWTPIFYHMLVNALSWNALGGG